MAFGPYPTAGHIDGGTVRRIQEGQTRINEGMRAGQQLGCCSCEGSCAIVTGGAVIGAIAAGVPTGGALAVPGAAAGALVGLAIAAVKQSIQEGRCVIL